MASRDSQQAFCTGTVVVVDFSEKRVILAADSRGNRGDGKYDDTQCKVITLGKHMLFASTGLSVHEDPIHGWSSQAVAHNAFAEAIASDNQEINITEVSQRWAKTMEEKIHSLDHAQISKFSQEKQLSCGIFAGVQGGRLMVYCVTLINEARGITSNVESMEPGMEFFGQTEIIEEFSNNETPWAKDQREKWKEIREASPTEKRDDLRAVHLVELTIAHYAKQDEVGGPVDAVELKKDGTIRWIQRKDGCEDS